MSKLDELATQRPTDHPGPDHADPHAITLPRGVNRSRLGDTLLLRFRPSVRTFAHHGSQLVGQHPSSCATRPDPATLPDNFELSGKLAGLREGH